MFEVGAVDTEDGFCEAADVVGNGVATDPSARHPAIPKTSTNSPTANRDRTALNVKRLNSRFGHAYMRIVGP